MPAVAEPLKGAKKLNALVLEKGSFGKNWDAATGGYQTLTTAPFESFTGDKDRASWLINADYAADWQMFQRDGKISRQ